MATNEDIGDRDELTMLLEDPALAGSDDQANHAALMELEEARPVGGRVPWSLECMKVINSVPFFFVPPSLQGRSSPLSPSPFPFPFFPFYLLLLGSHARYLSLAGFRMGESGNGGCRGQREHFSARPGCAT